jgi:UDP-glucose 4-epimerase
MRIVVTGGAGFIGSHVAEAAIAEGHQVCVIDNLSTGHRKNVPARAEFEELDICDAEGVRRLISDFKPDAISHQAAQASVSVSVREPAMDARVNVVGSVNVLEAARETGARVVYASTGGALYGEVPEGSKADTDSRISPLSPYACSKGAFETYLHAYAQGFGLPFNILRYANVYGPRQDPHGEAGVVAIFFERALRGQPMRVNARKTPGDDGCVRDYVYVDDVVRANMAALQGRLEAKIINAGTGIATTTRTLANKILELCKSDSELVDGDYRAGDLQRSVLEPRSFTAEIGEPTALETGLTATSAWFKAKLAAEA